MMLRYCLPFVLLASACGSDTPENELTSDPMMAMVDQGCPDIFHQAVFPNYEVTISPGELSALEDEFLNRVEREEMGLNIHPYHPIQLSYQGETSEAMIRLKGQSSWLQAIAFDENPKMQFVISFNEVDPKGRFHGVRKVELDMPRTDGSFLRQRLGLYYLRRAGVIAQCANNATLTINGDLYGLYTHIERLDKEFLQRQFEGFDDGDLWKGGIHIKTNDESYSMSRINSFWAVTSEEEMEPMVDLDSSIATWAGEAMAAQGDGYYMGRANFYLYDHPSRGFTWLPHDLDSSFDYLPADTSPLYPVAEGRHHNDRKHWNLVMADEARQDQYVEELRSARDLYEPEILQPLIAEFGAQIYQAADADPHKPFSTFDHEIYVQNLIDYPVAREATVNSFLECRDAGGINDVDGDDFADCFECDDNDPDVHPGATEICNGKDDNCDGLVDALESGEKC